MYVVFALLIGEWGYNIRAFKRLSFNAISVWTTFDPLSRQKDFSIKKEDRLNTLLPREKDKTFGSTKSKFETEIWRDETERCFGHLAKGCLNAF